MMIRNSLSTSLLGNLVVAATTLFLLFSSSPTTVVVKAQWTQTPPKTPERQNPPTQQFQPPPPPQQQFQDSSSSTTTCTATSADVVVIGAGIAGIRAAARIKEVAQDLTVVVLESTERTGGRVRAHYGFGETGDITIEDGANWIYEDGPNVIYKMAKAGGLQHEVAGLFDFTTYQYNANGDVTLVDKDDVTSAFNNFRSGPFQKAIDYGEQLWEEEDGKDFEVSKTLEENDYTPSNPLEYAAKWTYINFEHAAGDISHYAVFDVYSSDAFFVSDKKGYESIIQNYAKENNIEPIYDRRVYKIKYDSSVDPSMQSEAEVLARDSSGACHVYQAKRVISTVSTGVLNENLIDFVPALTRPAPENNPMEMCLYVKIFYQFPVKFWDESEYILTLRDEGNNILDDKDSLCMNWQNVDKNIQGSNILMCTLTTDEFDKLVGGEAYRNTATLSNNDLLDLLEPIRIAYPNFVEPTAMYYPPINKDADFGFGAYGDWKVGFTPYDYYRFYGGGSDNYYLANEPGEWDEKAVYDDCIHNGCNGNKEWILYVSGTASCLEYYEFVHGGYYAGEASATYALMSLGYENQIEPGWYDKCYDGILDGDDGASPEGAPEDERGEGETGDTWQEQRERDNEQPEEKKKKDKDDKNSKNGGNGESSGPVTLPKGPRVTPIIKATPHNHPILENDRGQAHQERKGSVTIIRNNP